MHHPTEQFAEQNELSPSAARGRLNVDDAQIGERDEIFDRCGRGDSNRVGQWIWIGLDWNSDRIPGRHRHKDQHLG